MYIEPEINTQAREVWWKMADEIVKSRQKVKSLESEVLELKRVSVFSLSNVFTLDSPAKEGALSETPLPLFEDLE